jgi:hypothetical protein
MAGTVPTCGAVALERVVSAEVKVACGKAWARFDSELEKPYISYFAAHPDLKDPGHLDLPRFGGQFSAWISGGVVLQSSVAPSRWGPQARRRRDNQRRRAVRAGPGTPCSPDAHSPRRQGLDEEGAPHSLIFFWRLRLACSLLI